MAMLIKNGLVRLNETAEHKILDYHLEHGFGIVSVFRHEESLTENTERLGFWFYKSYWWLF